ncbi:MFS transporter [Arthrobacter sp. JSM 101049]|uniref:MFS transporter n=1 Tax=Arthrobacter sp. JSM 101049 TaxID=929097 RepID=UPI003563FC39
MEPPAKPLSAPRGGRRAKGAPVSGPGGGPSARRGVVIAGLGFGQILSWGSTFYLLAPLAAPIAADTGWPHPWVVGGVSVALLVAALGSPAIGSLVSRNHGREVLAASALLLAGGLATLSLAPNQWLYLGAWVILGASMSGGLYSGAFAVLGHAYGSTARSSITALTLFGGFASTACWPLTTLLSNEFGWRWTCAAYAAAHLLVTFPLYVLLAPHGKASPEPAAEPHQGPPSGARQPGPLWLPVALIALITTLGTSVSAVVSVHVFTLLAPLGASGAVAVGLAAAIGPSQVGARLVEFTLARRRHPLWTMLTAVTAITTALALLALGLGPLLLPMVVYGAGIGLNSIANGTVPLALVGQERYARTMGRIALPSLLAQAAAPVWGTSLISGWGEKPTLLVLAAMSLAAAVLTLWLMLIHRRSSRLLPAPGTPS